MGKVFELRRYTPAPPPTDERLKLVHVIVPKIVHGQTVLVKVYPYIPHSRAILEEFADRYEDMLVRE